VLAEVLLLLLAVGLREVGGAGPVRSCSVVLAAGGDVIWADFDVFDEVLVGFAGGGLLIKTTG
jgi:hypothetical protein